MNLETPPTGLLPQHLRNISHNESDIFGTRGLRAADVQGAPHAPRIAPSRPWPGHSENDAEVSKESRVIRTGQISADIYYALSLIFLSSSII